MKSQIKRLKSDFLYENFAKTSFEEYASSDAVVAHFNFPTPDKTTKQTCLKLVLASKCRVRIYFREIYPFDEAYAFFVALNVKNLFNTL